MPLLPFNSGDAVLKKSPQLGNRFNFSNGKGEATITMWEVWNSRTKRQTVHYSKIINDEVTAIYRTHDKLASELETDDTVFFENATRRVQQVHPVKTAFGLSSMDYEITVI